MGLVFTRQSSIHPEIAIISKVLPDSIFSRHRLSSSSSTLTLLTPTTGSATATTTAAAAAATTTNHNNNNNSTGLEGAEVIAVNGTPVRDPRHAAELVARAVEEVRLTVKRGNAIAAAAGNSGAGGINGGGNSGAGGVTTIDTENKGRNDVDESDEGGDGKNNETMVDSKALPTSSSSSSAVSPKRTPPISNRQGQANNEILQAGGVELPTTENAVSSSLSVVPHVTSMGEESQYSVMTEKGDAVDDNHVEEEEEEENGGLRSAARFDTVVDKENGRNIPTSTTGETATTEREGMTMGIRRQQPDGTSNNITRTESSKSSEIVERRRKAAQAMLLSESLVEDPILNDATTARENLFDEAYINDDYHDDYDDEDDWNHDQKIDFSSAKSDNTMGGKRVSDPIQLDRLGGEDDEVFADPFITADSGRSSSKEGLMSNNPSMSQYNDVASSATPRAKTTPKANAPPLSTSAADRRRQAALKMYNSSEMVPDNVDDVRLGTIDAVSPPATSKHGRDNAMLSPWMKAEPLNEVGRVTSFGSTTSRARTDITTSSVATARMGGSGRPSPRLFGKGSPSSREFSFSDVAAASALVARTHAGAAAAAAPPTPGIQSNDNALGSSPTKAIESPAAQRRLQRAVDRQLGADGVAASISGPKGGNGSGDRSPVVPSTMSPNGITHTTRDMNSATTPKSSKVTQRHLGDNDEFVDESPPGVIDSNDAGAIAHPILNMASESALVSNRAGAEIPRSTRNSLRFGKMAPRGRQRGQSAGTAQTGYSQVQEEAPKKKMSSIFGVAKLIRKASVSLFQFFCLWACGFAVY